MRKLGLVAGVTAVLAPVVGWLCFAIAIALGDEDFNPTDNDAVVALLLLASIGLGLVALVAWLVAVIAVVHGFSERKTDPAVTRSFLLALVAPATWFFEWCVVVLWFGYSALSGPWIFMAA